MIPCRFGCSVTLNYPVVIVALSTGCLCFPDDTRQVLCLHHAMRAAPRGIIQVVEVLPDAGAFDYQILQTRFPEVTGFPPPLTEWHPSIYSANCSE